MSDIRIKMAKDLRDMSDMVGDLHWMAAKAVEDLIKKDGEIAKRDARIVELEARIVWLECEAQVNAAPVPEAKAQGVVMPPSPYMPGSQPTDFTDYELGEIHGRIAMWEEVKRLNAAPVQQVSVPDGWKLVPDHPDADAIVTALYRRFKDWAQQGFGPDDVTWCEVKADILALIAAAPAAPAADAWIQVSERLPDSGSTVIAYYLNSYGKGRTIRAQHVESWTIESEDVADADAECVDYSEQDDCYYLLQGWYECIDNWDEYYRVAVTEGPITHWMPLPAAPSANSAKGVV